MLSEETPPSLPHTDVGVPMQGLPSDGTPDSAPPHARSLSRYALARAARQGPTEEQLQTLKEDICTHMMSYVSLFSEISAPQSFVDNASPTPTPRARGDPEPEWDTFFDQCKDTDEAEEAEEAEGGEGAEDPDEGGETDTASARVTPVFSDASEGSTKSAPDLYADVLCDTCLVGRCQPDAGFMVCVECGTVGEACIESGAEWRSFGGADAKVTDPSRCGASASNYLMSGYAYAAGTQISTRWRRESEKMHMAQLLQRRLSANPKSRPLRNTFNEFKRTTYNCGYSHKIVDDALHLYTSAKKVKNFRADNRKGLMAKCLAEACKKHGVSRSAKEICKDMGISVDIMTKGHRALTKARQNASESNYKIIECSKLTRKTVDQPVDFVDRFCSKLHLPADITEEIREVCRLTKQMRLVSDNAPLVTAACILLVAVRHRLKVTSADIQKVVNISHVTIDKCYKKVREFKEVLLAR